MSRLNDLLRQLRMENPGLADDLQREFDALADRRSFGLNFERHVPEAVELPGRPVRKGDKVRILPPRGEMPTAENDRLWQVVAIERDEDVRRATLISLDYAEQDALVAVEDLVVVAEFRDPIYPGLVSTGKIERGGDKPFHTVINAENFHALQTLLFTHRGKVDCIYIDPPYNTGAKDWKYNNDYVEGDDHYRHSKWLAFMERRLLLAREFLNPDGSVLIVTIDEKEYLRLGLLLEQTLPDARMQMVTSVINPSGSSRQGQFSRSDEYLFWVFIGDAVLTPTYEDMLRPHEGPRPVRWDGLVRRGANGRRRARPNLFYPLFFDAASGAFHSAGPSLDIDASIEDYPAPAGTVAAFPLGTDGSERTWGISQTKFRDHLAKGYVRFGPWSPTQRSRSVYHLQSGTIASIEAGEIEIDGTDENGALVLRPFEKKVRPLSTWNKAAHSAGDHGSSLLRRFIPDREFAFPKSLYAVEDALRFIVGERPDALILDFFAGSGTTLHAVMRLNRQDAGSRRCILVTNNEVSAGEQQTLRKQGQRPGDSEWEQWGICEYITRPRVAAAITGLTPEGDPIKGDYTFSDEYPMADGLHESVEFFTLTYEAPLSVASNREFERIAPLLWLRAGSCGRRIDDISTGWDVADVYGVLADLDQSEPFLKSIAEKDDVTMAFIVTDEDRLFEALVAELPDHVEPVRLYEAYLRNFEIEAGRSAR